MMCCSKLKAGVALICAGMVATGTSGKANDALQAPAVVEATATATTRPAGSRLQFRFVLDASEAATRPAEDMQEPGSRAGALEDVWVEERAVVDDSMVESAKVLESSDSKGHYNVLIQFTPDGAKRMQQITGDNIGRRLGIVFRGKLIAAPTIHSMIGGSAEISGGSDGFTKADADAMVRALSGHKATTTKVEAKK